MGTLTCKLTWTKIVIGPISTNCLSTKILELSFGSNYRIASTIQHKAISQKTRFRCLSQFLDSKLTLRDQIIHLVRKLKKVWGPIFRVKDIYSVNCLLSLYDAMTATYLIRYKFIAKRREETFEKLKWHRGELSQLFPSVKILIAQYFVRN